jgi:hypothetical protein
MVFDNVLVPYSTLSDTRHSLITTDRYEPILAGHVKPICVEPLKNAASRRFYDKSISKVLGPPSITDRYAQTACDPIWRKRCAAAGQSNGAEAVMDAFK